MAAGMAGSQDTWVPVPPTPSPDARERTGAGGAAGVAGTPGPEKRGTLCMEWPPLTAAGPAGAVPSYWLLRPAVPLPTAAWPRC